MRARGPVRVLDREGGTLGQCSVCTRLLMPLLIIMIIMCMPLCVSGTPHKRRPLLRGYVSYTKRLAHAVGAHPRVVYNIGIRSPYVRTTTPAGRSRDDERTIRMETGVADDPFGWASPRTLCRAPPPTLLPPLGVPGKPAHCCCPCTPAPVHTCVRMVKPAVFHRLYERGQASLVQRDKRTTERAQVISPECTFSPRVSPTKERDDPVRACLVAMVSAVAAMADEGTTLPALQAQYRQTLPRRRDTTRFARLYNDGQDRRRRLDIAHYEHRGRLPQECTFKPAVTTTTKPPVHGGTGPSVAGTFANVLQRSEEYQRRRERQRREHLRQPPAGCTFVPAINRAPAAKTAAPSSDTSTDRCQRLYEQGAAYRAGRQADIEKQKVARALRKQAETTSLWGSPHYRPVSGGAFTPVSPDAPTPPPTKASRAGKLSAATRKPPARVRSPELAQCTFTPRTNGGKRADATPIYDRLYKHGTAHIKRAQRRAQQKPTGCTFQPTVHRSGGGGKGGADYDRLYAESQKRLQRRDAAHASLPAECTFVPRINGAARGSTTVAAVAAVKTPRINGAAGSSMGISAAVPGAEVISGAELIDEAKRGAAAFAGPPPPPE